jgi:ribonucleases P/MRP protein subunit RPP40
MKLFADDSKLYRIISTPTDSTHLQADLNSVFEWSTSWQMNLNLSKCKVMRVGGKDSPSYHIGGVLASTTTSERDLGVIISDDLKPRLHIEKICASSRRKCSLIFKCFVCRDVSFLSRMFCTYVRPTLEYCTVAWSPFYLKDIDAVERVQRAYTKRIPCLAKLSYLDRLKVCKLDLLEIRRLRTDLTFLYRILNNLISVDYTMHFSRCTNATTRGHSFKLMPALGKTVRKDCLKYSYFERVIPLWNALSESTVSASSLSQFKKRVVLENPLLLKYCRGRAIE